MAKNSISKEFKIGVFSLVILIALYFTIQFLRGSDFFQGTNTFYAKYPTVEGLTPSSPISVLGLKAGTIDRITFDQANHIMVVRLRINKDFHIPTGSVAQIYSADILGGKAIQIQLSDSQTYCKSKDTLDASIEQDIIGVLTNGLSGVLDQVNTLLASLGNSVTQLNSILSQENSTNIEQALASLNSSLSGIDTFCNTLRQNAPQVDHIIGNVDKLSTDLDGSLAHLDSTLQNLNDITSEIKDADLSGTISQLKLLAEDLRNPEGSLGRLMNQPTLHDNLNDLLTKIDTLIEEISNNPKKFLKISVF